MRRLWGPGVDIGRLRGRCSKWQGRPGFKAGELGMQCEGTKAWLSVYGSRESDGEILLLGQVSWHQTPLQEHVTCVDEFVALQVPDAVEDPPTYLTGMNIPESREKPQELHTRMGSSLERLIHCEDLICWRVPSASRHSFINGGEAKRCAVFQLRQWTELCPSNS